MKTNELEKVKKQSSLADVYLVKGTIGKTSTPGAPVAHFALVVSEFGNSVNGSVEITQAIAPPYGRLTVKNVTGTIRSTGYGKVTKVVSLEGTYYVSLPPPAIGTITEKFSASLAIDNEWDGSGAFSYGNSHIENVPVEKS